MNICACGICRDDCTYHKTQAVVSKPSDWGKTPRERMDNLGRAWREGRITAEEANAIFDAPTAPMDPVAFLRGPTADAYEFTYRYEFYDQHGKLHQRTP